REAPLAGLEIDVPCDDAALGDAREERLEIGDAHFGFDDHLELTAAGKAEAPRFLARYAVRGELRLAAGVILAARHQVVLDAAARDRAHEDAVVADRGERAGRPRARAERLRHGEQPHAPALAPPVARALEDVQVE